MKKLLTRFTKHEHSTTTYIDTGILYTGLFISIQRDDTQIQQKLDFILCVRSCRNGVGPVTANKSTGGAGVRSNFNCVNNEPWDTQHVHKHQEDHQKHGRW